MLGCTCIPILVFYGILFNCMTVVQASDSMYGLNEETDLKLSSRGWCLMLVFGWVQ